MYWCSRVGRQDQLGTGWEVESQIHVRRRRRRGALKGHQSSAEKSPRMSSVLGQLKSGSTQEAEFKGALESAMAGEHWAGFVSLSVPQLPLQK